MEMKKILGLDLGTNSIGAALINLPKSFEDYGKKGSIKWLVSRIVPFDSDYTKAYELGQNGSPQVKTPAANRRGKRGSRRLKHRYKLRRTRLIKVFKTLGWLSEDFPLDDNRKIKRILAEEGKFQFRISDHIPFSDQTYREFYQIFGYDENTINNIIEEIHYRRNSNGKKKNPEIKLLPEDWIVYFLRKKALTERIEIPELIRIVYMMNQRRGFKSSRKDLKETTSLPYEEFEKIKHKSDEYKNENFETQFVAITKVIKVEELNEKGKGDKQKYRIHLDDKRIEPYTEERKSKPEWEGKEFTFLVTQKLEKGKFKQNKPGIPTEDDWGLCTTALDGKMGLKYPGEFFFDELVKAFYEKRNYKIRQYPVHRWRYQKELEKIWNVQCEINPELSRINTDREQLRKIATLLYPAQSQFSGAKMKELISNDLLHIISKDIIYYQRELKSQKGLISECRYEKRKGIDGEDYGLKCVPKSSPLFQEFRIWQDIHNIRLLKKQDTVDGKMQLDKDVTADIITESIKEKLFELFNSKENISEPDILKLIIENNPNCGILLDIKGTNHSHRINLFANRSTLKGNETLHRYRKVFEKHDYNGNHILNDWGKLYRLWHSDYSISSSDEKLAEKGILSALGWKQENNEYIPNKNWSFFELPVKICTSISKLPEIEKSYGSFSSCAIKKMLPVIRCGKFWNEAEVSPKQKSEAENIQARLNSINHNPKRILEVVDDDIEKQVLKSFLGKKEFIKGLSPHQAAYLTYGRHSEKDIAEVKSPEEFSEYIIKALPHNNLRNPIVEQVVREALLLTRDVWEQFGDIDEIHIELGRDLKNNSEQRNRLANTQKENFEEKQKIKQLLKELLNENFEHYDEDGNKITTTFTVNPNPNNPQDIEKFKIWKELSGKKDEEFDKKVKEEKIPTELQVKKYILWLSQNCRSPYTGKIIPLSKLFDKLEYEIEHIIPRSKLKNDSYNNIIIAEAAINPEPFKGNKLARNFISQFGGKDGKEYEINGRKYRIMGEREYEDYCNNTFKYQWAKLKNLLATEPPEDFIERQLNDTRYIGRKLAELLKPVTKDPNGIIFTIGTITNELKDNWGLHRVWKDIIRPRFERLEKIIEKKLIYEDENDKNNYHFDLSINPKLEKDGIKRLDHRHHALDAVVIAATTREHIRYLNTLNATDSDEDKRKYYYSLCKGKIRDFKQPWNDFTKDVKEWLMNCIVTFKKSKPIITKPFNLYERWELKEKQWKKVKNKQAENPGWKAIRRSMFKEPLGTVWLKKIKEVSVPDALQIQIEKMIAEKEHNSTKTLSYIYDKDARQVFKDLILKSSFSLSEPQELWKELKKYLTKNSTKVPAEETGKNGKGKTKTIYSLNGFEFERIHIAEFRLYKTKRMSLTKQEYVEKLTLEKMVNDFPYFVIEYEVLKRYPSMLEKIESENKLEITYGKRNSPVNNLFLHHILEYKNNPKEAFSAEGIDKLNQKAVKDKKIGKPIKSITRLDGLVEKDDMFRGAFFETDKGSNVYFIMYENLITHKREYLSPSPSISVLTAIEKLTKNEPLAPKKEGFRTIQLSPGDLVYVPSIKEQELIEEGSSLYEIIAWNNKNYLSERIYQTISFTGKSCLFRKYNIADTIIPSNAKEKIKGEIDWHDKSEFTMDNNPIRIKDVCIKLWVDRLGKISPAH
jgi:CRISPR-associated endonuclease Csn1